MCLQRSFPVYLPSATKTFHHVGTKLARTIAIAPAQHTEHASHDQSTDMGAGDLGHKAIVQLLGQIFPSFALDALERTVGACIQGLQIGRQPHLLRTQLRAGGRIAKAIDHVPVRRLCVVALVVGGVGPLVDVSLVAIGAAVAVQVPLQERHRLDVQELVFESPADDVGEAHTNGTAIGGDLHEATRLDVRAQGTEEQAHEVLVAPIHDRVPVKEALDRPGMREVVVHGAQRLLQALELVIDRDPGAIHSVPHLREVVLLQGLDGVVDLLVALPERVEVLEGRRDDAADMTQGLAVLGELQREGQVRVPEDRSVSHRIDELEPSEAAHGSQARCLRDGCCRGVVIDVVFVLRLLNDLLQLLRPVVRRQHEAQLPMLQASEDLVFGQVQLPAVGEGSH
mmetsp:Transcript_66399/g.216055  ORF Transcript_66399/g.216055 Transcript_66399/m.216055 type:complete len:397 (+) Transcript_66399:172-1362(+)